MAHWARYWPCPESYLHTPCFASPSLFHKEGVMWLSTKRLILFWAYFSKPYLASPLEGICRQQTASTHACCSPVVLVQCRESRSQTAILYTHAVGAVAQQGNQSSQLTTEIPLRTISTIPCQNVTMVMLGWGPNRPMANFPVAPAAASAIFPALCPTA